MLRHELGDAAFWRVDRPLRPQARARLGRDAGSRARHRGGDAGATSTSCSTAGSRAPGHPELEGALGVGRGSEGRDAAPRAEAADHARGAAVQVLGAGALRDRRPRARRARQRVRSDARLRVPPARAPDPGDLRSGRRRAEVDPPGEESRPLWRRQLAAARLAIDRVAAARALGQLPDPAGIAALATALRGDAFWGVRAAAARALGQTRRDDARDALVAAIDDEHPRVRRAVAAALGEFLGDEAAARALADRLRRGDASYFVEAEAALALGRTRTPRRWRCCRRCSTGRRTRTSSAAAPSRVWAAPATSARSRSCAMRGAPASRGSAGARSSRRWPSWRAAPGSPAPAREFIEARLADRDFRVRGEAAVGAGPPRIDRGDRRAASAPAPPSSTAAPAGAWKTPSAISRPARAPARRSATCTTRSNACAARPPSCASASIACRPQPAPPPRRRPPPPAPKTKRPRPVTRRTRGSRPVRR